jgi:hypothetical protein
MKEFSQKHSVLLLWLTIILLIISISLSVCAFGGKNSPKNFKGGERGGMMQDSGRMMNNNDSRGFNRNSNTNNRNMVNPSQGETQENPSAPVGNEPVTN